MNHLPSRAWARIGIVLICFCGGLSLAACGDDSDSNSSYVKQNEFEGAGQDSGIKDHASPELRGLIEKLKKDIENEPTNLSTLDERAKIFWKWTNVFALNGGVAPVEAPIIAAGVLSTPELRGKERPAMFGFDLPKELDRYVREYTLKENDPNVAGKLVTETPGPFRTGDFVTLSQTWTVGNKPMQPGGGIMVTSHYFNREIVPQFEDPKAPNFVSIKSSNPNAQFIAERVPLGGQHGGFRSEKGVVVYRLDGATLNTGDTVTITYGDKSKGSPGFQTQLTTTDRYPLPVYVDLGDGDFLTLPIQPIKVLGGPVVRVHGFAPSIVKLGSAATIALRNEDAFFNRATGSFPAYDVFQNGKFIKTVAAGDHAIVNLKGTFDKPGVHRFTFRSKDGRITGEANPILVEENPKRYIYWGETHGHSGFAEGIGTPDSFYLFARDDAHLDFALHSEHDAWMDDAEWEELRTNASQFTREGEFYAFLGFEWSQQPNHGGHHNVMFRTPEKRLRAGLQDAPLLADLYRMLKAKNKASDVLVIPHAHMPGDWRQSDTAVERLVEITSLHGTFEAFGRSYLAQGHEIGFVGGSDDHFSHPGYATPQPNGMANRSGLAAVRAPQKSRDAIFDGLRARSTYATSGEHIILDVRINGAEMGSRTGFAPERKIEGRVIGTAPIESVTVVKNGKELSSQDYLTAAAKNSLVVGIEFASDSASYKGNYDIPRGWREWKGTITVSGARIKALHAASFKNPHSQKAAIDPANSNRVTFRTMTRGTVSSLFIELQNVTADARIAVHVDAAKESNSVPSLTRKAGAELKGKDISLKLNEIAKNRMDVPFPVDDFYTDRMTIRRAEAQPLMERSFSIIDRLDAKPGDYYYVRVLQTDGAMAWSSPVWIGSHASAIEQP